MADAAGVDEDVRQTPPMVRRLFLGAAVLVFVMSAILYLGPTQTDRYFAWTIRVPLTAMFLGAAYFGSGLSELAASRTPAWAEARIAAPAVLVFSLLTLMVTLVHGSQFHYGPGHGPPARVVAWSWLVIYIAFPVVMGYALLRRPRGVDAPRGPGLGRLRPVLWVQAALMAVVGVAFLVAPGVTRGWWPWPLTDLTAQAIGAWGVGLAFGVATAAVENDWRRIRVANPIMLGFGLLALLAMVIWRGEVAWGQPSAWVLTALLASLVAGAGYALARAGAGRA